MGGKNKRGVANKSPQDWKLDWFVPNKVQEEAVLKFDNSVFNIIDAPAGCGKTALAIWFAFHEYKNRNYSRILFLKSPTEVGDDEIGFLPGTEGEKLAVHLESTRELMFEFISPNKLENDEKNRNIVLDIPNYKLGATWDDTLVIVDEAQLMSEKTLPHILKRCGKGTKYIILGDAKQRYAASYRNDGFTDFILRSTTPVEGSTDRIPKNNKMVSYTKITSSDNMRSEGSAYITDLYDD